MNTARVLLMQMNFFSSFNSQYNYDEYINTIVIKKKSTYAIGGPYIYIVHLTDLGWLLVYLGELSTTLQFPPTAEIFTTCCNA